MSGGLSALQQPRSASEPGWVDDVLRYWFSEMSPKNWFVSDPAVDDVIRHRFAALLATLSADTRPFVPADSRTALARVIVLDQIPRNIHRGTPEAFVTDAMALDTARAAVAAHLDRSLDAPGRLFLYLPFEHSEAAADQQRAVDLIGAIGNAEYTRFAQAHKDIIDRFGRFPHRNRILGRPSTPEEIAFLAQPGSSF